MNERRRNYFSYLVRLWRSGQGEEATWSASAECPLTGERQGFASLEALYAFLRRQVYGEEDEATSDGPEGGGA